MEQPHIEQLISHAKHIKSQELMAADLLLKSSGSDTALESLGEFAIEAYCRVSDMFDWDDFGRCNRFVMVGSGPLPVTLLHVAKRFPGMQITGIDTDPESVHVSRRVVKKFGIDNIHLHQLDGRMHAYQEADIIYVANLVHPKSEVLRQIANTANPGTLVILRDPTENGAQLADVGIASIGDRFSIEGTGIPSQRFESRHIFLRVLG